MPPCKVHGACWEPEIFTSSTPSVCTSSYHETRTMTYLKVCGLFYECSSVSVLRVQAEIRWKTELEKDKERRKIGRKWNSQDISTRISDIRDEIGITGNEWIHVPNGLGESS